jgi:predicted O-methyltransferase YrrM
MQINDLDHLLEQRKLIDRLQKQAADKKIPVIGKNTGYFLGFLVKMIKPASILEIGCGDGFSSYFILKNMAEGSSYTGIDMNRQRLEDARDLINHHFPGMKHNFICGNALKLIPGSKEIFDMVFIDAAKFEYPLYLEAVKEKIKEGSIIIADDIFYNNNIFSREPSGHFVNSVEGIRKYLQSTGPGTGFDTILVDIDDGLAVSIYRGAHS